MSEKKWIDRDALLERARQLDSYAWSDFVSIVEEQPAFTPEQVLARETAADAGALMAVQFCRCDNPDDCPLAAYERRERRLWQHRAQELEKRLSDAEALIRALRADVQQYRRAAVELGALFADNRPEE